MSDNEGICACLMIGCGHRFIGLPPLGVLWLRAVPFPFVFARLRAKAAQGIVYLVEVLEGLRFARNSCTNA